MSFVCTYYSDGVERTKIYERKKYWGPDVIENLKKDLACGYTVSSCARKYNMSRPTVYKYSRT